MVTKEDPKNNQVIKLLEVLQETPERDPRAAIRGRAKFLAEARSLHAAVSPSPFHRLKQWIATNPIFGIRKERSAMMTAITSILLALAILLGGGGITAYAAQDSLPNDALYPVKLFLEDAQYSLTNNPVEQVELLAQFTSNRLDEIATLVSEGEEVPEEVTTDLQVEQNGMLILAAGLDEENTVSALLHIRDQTRDQDNFCNQLGLDAETDPGLALACYTIRNMNRVAEDGLDSPLEFQQRFGYHGGEPWPVETEEPGEPVEPTEEPGEPVEPTEEPGEPVEPTEEPGVDRPGSCTDPDGCKPEETGNPDAGQNGGDNENNAVNGNNGQNGGQGGSGYYLYIGTHLYYYSNGIYIYVGNGQNGGRGGNGGGNGGGGGR